jgi:hypothetical protein
MNTFDHGRPFAACARRAPTLRKRASWYRTSWHAMEAPPWPGLLATLLAAALLVAFVQVVRAGVDKGESRKRDVAAHADRVWRCNIQPSATQRAGCRAQLDAEARAAPSP